jgi:hypothetical protein
MGWAGRIVLERWRLRWRRFGAADSFHVAFALILLVVNFSGVTLGEVGRLWLPYMPFLAILAAAALLEHCNSRPGPLVLMLALSFATAMVLKMRMGWI